VEAKSETGPALHAIAAYPDQGARAIVAEGPVEFSSAGRGMIARGATQARVVSPVALSAEVSKILVTLLANPAGPWDRLRSRTCCPIVRLLDGRKGCGRTTLGRHDRRRQGATPTRHDRTA
jgi:hypothetical protein